MTSFEERLGRLGLSKSRSQTQADLETMRQIDTLSYSLEPVVHRPDSDDNDSPSRTRALELQIRLLKNQLADEQSRNVTAAEEIADLRTQLKKSNEVLITFAQRAREDREEVGRRKLSKSMRMSSSESDSVF